MDGSSVGPVKSPLGQRDSKPYSRGNSLYPCLAALLPLLCERHAFLHLG